MTARLSNSSARLGERVALLPHVTMGGVPKHLVDRVTDLHPIAHNSSNPGRLKGVRKARSYEQTPGRTFKTDRHAGGLTPWMTWQEYQRRFAPKPPI